MWRTKQNTTQVLNNVTQASKIGILISILLFRIEFFLLFTFAIYAYILEAKSHAIHTSLNRLCFFNCHHTVCLRSLDPFHILSYYKNKLGQDLFEILYVLEVMTHFFANIRCTSLAWVMSTCAFKGTHHLISTNLVHTFPGRGSLKVFKAWYWSSFLLYS